MNQIIFIDRDGVINIDLIGDYVKSWNEFRFEKGALEALKAFHEAGYAIIVVSNQAGIGDGVYPEEQLWDTHSKMIEALKKQGVTITDAFFCLHGKEAGCGCRKPETGLFEQAAAKYRFDKSKTYFIGDKVTDIAAGKKFGLKTFFVRTGHGKNEEKLLTGNLKPDQIADNLLQASKVLLS